MSHPELFRDMKCPFYLFGKRECRGRQPSAGVLGAPEKHLFLLLLAACGGERGKRSYWGHPKPRQGNPAPPVLGTFSKVRDDSLQQNESEPPAVARRPVSILFSSKLYFHLYKITLYTLRYITHISHFSSFWGSDYL